VIPVTSSPKENSTMVTAAEKKRQAEAEAAAADETVDTGHGITQPEDSNTPLSTSTDALGIDRVVLSGVQDGWTPAPVDPDPVAVKRAEEREKRREEGQ
jgi:hypothetical protein